MRPTWTFQKTYTKLWCQQNKHQLNQRDGLVFCLGGFAVKVRLRLNNTNSISDHHTKTKNVKRKINNFAYQITNFSKSIAYFYLKTTRIQDYYIL